MKTYIITRLAGGKVQLEPLFANNEEEDEQPLVLNTEHVQALRRVLQNPLIPRFELLTHRFRHLSEIIVELPVESNAEMQQALSRIEQAAFSITQEAQRLAELAKMYRACWELEAKP